jgi:hypothetical protein
MKVAIAVIGFLLASAFASVPDVQACGGWWDPCCPWYEPERCEAFKKRKKDVAEYVENYMKRRTVDLAAIGLALGFIPAAGPAVGQATRGGALVAAVVSEMAGRVKKDPPTDLYLEFYQGGPWPSAESLGLGSYTGWWWNDYPIEAAQNIAWYTDYITTEADRYTSCKQVGPDVCPDWVAQYHKDLVNWGLWNYGWYHGALAEFWWNIAAYAEQEGLADDPTLLNYLVSIIREMADIAGWVEQEFQNDWD